MQEVNKMIWRHWLTFMNTIAFIVAALVLYGGVNIYTASNIPVSTADNTTKVTSAETYGVGPGDFNQSLHNVGIVLITYGCLVFFTSVWGSIGACAKSEFMLWIAFICNSIEVLLGIAAGAFGLINQSQQSNAWQTMTRTQWNAFLDSEKDYYQYYFKCCGLLDSSLKNTATVKDVYTGLSYVAGEGGSSICATPDGVTDIPTYLLNAPGCQFQAQNAFKQRILMLGIGVAIVAFIMGCAAAAALFLRNAIAKTKGTSREQYAATFGLNTAVVGANSNLRNGNGANSVNAPILRDIARNAHMNPGVFKVSEQTFATPQTNAAAALYEQDKSRPGNYGFGQYGAWPQDFQQAEISRRTAEGLGSSYKAFGTAGKGK